MKMVAGMAVKGVILDMDGTLVDSVDLHAQSWQRVLADPMIVEGAREVPLLKVRAQIGKGGDKLMAAFLPADVVDRDGAAIEAARTALFEAEYVDRVRGFPDVAALVRALTARGVRVAIGSSGKEEEVQRNMRLVGIDGLGLVMTTSDDAERTKPHPDIFQVAVEKLGLAAAEVLVVGDTAYDAQAALGAGAVPVGVLCGGVSAQELRDAGCVAVYQDPADLLSRLDEAGGPVFGAAER